jgi:predicted pyridoxine 5'-phosphate oxidase superfamily flavin-nucleotide-binding protein
MPTRHAILAALFGIALTTAGCNIVGPAAYFIAGPEKTPARYTLPIDRPTVIFIDDRKSIIPRRTLRNSVADTAQTRLLNERVVKDMIAAQSAIQAAGRDGPDGPLPASEIGRRVGADIIIVASVDSFRLTPDGSTYRPEAQMRVRVIDCKAESRLWPADDIGHQVITTLRTTARSTPTTTSEQFKAEEELAQAAGEELARLFYKHEREKGLRTPN